MLKKRLWSLIMGLSLFTIGCTQNPAFSIQGDSNTFKQNANDLQVKVDILWVIDNSGSMANSQAALAANFQSFMAKFQATNFDYRMAVATTDAWRASFDTDYTSRFRDGTDQTSHTGVTVITPTTQNLEQTFITNVVQGINGHADERGLQSMKDALENPANAAEPFPREGAILAVIALTDEEDFSHDDTDSIQGPGGYNDPRLHPVSLYYDYLFNLTNSSGSEVNFIFNTVAIIDQDCQASLTQSDPSGWTGRMVAQRYMELSDLSNGYKGSICDDFSDVMAGISDSILELATQFVLDREPLVETIIVYVDGQQIPQDSENGWSYKASANAIVFHGSAIPGKNSVIQVSFDPAGLK